MLILIKLLLAHLLGDFILQPAAWVKEKEEKKLGSFKLYLHAFLHGLLSLLLIGRLSFWLPALFIAVTHAMIDALKLISQKEGNKRQWFLVDQLLHLLVLVLVSCWWIGAGWPVALFSSFRTWLVVTAVLALTSPASVVIKIFISKWAPYTGDVEGDSLQSAGKYIGFLERLLILVFILTGHWEAVGFLMAAKSIFRFGDLKEAKDRKLTEYILIGTFLSFGIAILTALVTSYLLS